MTTPAALSPALQVQGLKHERMVNYSAVVEQEKARIVEWQGKLVQLWEKLAGLE